MYLNFNEDDLCVQEHTAWAVHHNIGYYSNTSVVLGSYSTISYFIFQGLFVNTFKLAYHLKTLARDFFTTILFNIVVMATIYFTWNFTCEKTVALSQANKEWKKKFISISTNMEPCNNSDLAWSIKSTYWWVWAIFLRLY